MKKGLLASTAIAGAAALIGTSAGAAEAPTWKLTGNANFQLYWVDQDADGTYRYLSTGSARGILGTTTVFITGPAYKWNTVDAGVQEHDWYFGVDEAELQLNVSGTADNGLNYGFKIEINANTTDTKVADEVRLQLSGSWGTVQLGDEDGAEDIMNYGGENLMGAAGGFDGDLDDVLFRDDAGSIATLKYNTGSGNMSYFDANWLAPGGPTIAGDTSDATKISYYSPRFSGFQFGASLTPTPNNGDDFKADGDWENHYGIAANYDNSFGDLRIRASAVYSANSSNDSGIEDVSAWSVGGIVGWGPFSLGANYTDNAESGQPKIWDDGNGVWLGSGRESSYWDVAARFETGPMAFAVGYFSSTLENNLPAIAGGAFDDSTFTVLSLTADYSMAPGLSLYAEYDMTSDEMFGGGGTPADDFLFAGPEGMSNDASVLIVGANVSF